MLIEICRVNINEYVGIYPTKGYKVLLWGESNPAKLESNVFAKNLGKRKWGRSLKKWSIVLICDIIFEIRGSIVNIDLNQVIEII